MGERRGRCKGGIEWIVPREKYPAGLWVGRFVKMQIWIWEACVHTGIGSSFVTILMCHIIEQIKSVSTGFKFKENNFKTWL